jgi:hypothetical protein
MCPYGVLATVMCCCSSAGAAPWNLGRRGSVPLPGDSSMVAIAHTLLPQWQLGPALLQAPVSAHLHQRLTPCFRKDTPGGNRSYIFVSFFVVAMCVAL